MAHMFQQPARIRPLRRMQAFRMPFLATCVSRLRRRDRIDARQTRDQIWHHDQQGEQRQEEEKAALRQYLLLTRVTLYDRQDKSTSLSRCCNKAGSLKFTLNTSAASPFSKFVRSSLARRLSRPSIVVPFTLSKRRLLDQEMSFPKKPAAAVTTAQRNPPQAISTATSRSGQWCRVARLVRSYTA